MLRLHVRLKRNSCVFRVLIYVRCIAYVINLCCFIRSSYSNSKKRFYPLYTLNKQNTIMLIRSTWGNIGVHVIAHTKKMIIFIYSSRSMKLCVFLFLWVLRIPYPYAFVNDTSSWNVDLILHRLSMMVSKDFIYKVYRTMYVEYYVSVRCPPLIFILLAYFYAAYKFLKWTFYRHKIHSFRLVHRAFVVHTTHKILSSRKLHNFMFLSLYHNYINKIIVYGQVLVVRG